MKIENIYKILLNLILVVLLLVSSSCRTKKEYTTEQSHTYIDEKIESLLSEIKTDYLDMIIKSSLAGDAIIREKIFDLDRPPDSITGEYPVKIEREVDLSFQKVDSASIKKEQEVIKDQSQINNKQEIIDTEVDIKKEINNSSWINKIKNILLIGVILTLLLFLFKHFNKKSK